MTRKRIKWEGGYIIVRSGSVQDDLVAQVIESKLLNASPEDMYGFYRQFGQLCSQAEKSEGLPWKPENMSKADLFVLQGAYASYLNMPLTLRGKWTKAQTDLNKDDAVVIEDDWEANPDPKSPAAQS